MRAALTAAALAPGAVRALEMHGTGTALGDPIEVGAVSAVLQVGTPPASCMLVPWYPAVRGRTWCAAFHAAVLHS